MFKNAPAMNEKNIFFYIMIAPALLLTLLLGVYPMARKMIMSFQSYDLLNVQTEGPKWVGLENYQAILSDDHFLQTVSQTVIFTILAVAISVGMGLFLSQIVNAKFRGRAVVRTLIFANAGFSVPFAVLLLHGYFQTSCPLELEEAAMMEAAHISVRSGLSSFLCPFQGTRQ